MPGDDSPERDRSDGPLFAYARREEVLQVRRAETRWLSTGWNGGETVADAAYNATVPEGFDRMDLDVYARKRRATAGFDASGPTLFTGVSQAHARGARAGPVEAVATAGLSNPATLPVPDRLDGPDRSDRPDLSDRSEQSNRPDRTVDDPDSGPADPPGPRGTVNIILGTSRALGGGALASLLATVVEAKTATLLQATGFTGTTTDAVVVGCDPAGPETAFAGAATDLGSAARACVREAVLGSLRSRYRDEPVPASVATARHGCVTDRPVDVFRPE